jgi:hypothetical protein
MKNLLIGLIKAYHYQIDHVFIFFQLRHLIHQIAGSQQSHQKAV